ncbi:MAG: hypothetical protein EXX96DRAFT_590849, partial [Benjaminiella poitrasii]
MEHATYQPPDMIPDAARKIQRTQQKQDASLKRLQYLVSATFRPLDILGHEISLDAENTAAQRYMEILLNCRLLLLNLSSQVNQMRTNLAFQAINPAFYNTASPSETNYVMPITEFQSAVAQQVNTAQTFRKATNKPFRRRFGKSYQQYGSSSSAATHPQFFFEPVHPHSRAVSTTTTTATTMPPVQTIWLRKGTPATPFASKPNI